MLTIGNRAGDLDMNLGLFGIIKNYIQIDTKNLSLIENEEIKPEILKIFGILNQLCETNKIEPKIMAIAPQRLIIFKKDKTDL